MKRIIKKIWKSKFWLLIVVVILILINWAASIYHTRVDLTNEKRFTLSNPTVKILQNLDEVVQVDIFLKGEFPSAFKKLANSAGETLNEFRDISGNKLVYNFISPDDLMEGSTVKWSDTLTASGLYPINLKSQLKAGEQQQLVFPYALVHFKDGVLPVDLFSGNKTFISPAELNSAEALMEYKFADAISKLSKKVKPMLAYSIGNGEPTGTNTYDLVENNLRKDYSLFTFNLNTQPEIPDTFKILMIVKPTKPFTEEEKFKIDQFVMKGGKLIMFVDKLEAELDSLQSMSNQVVAYDRNLNLDDLLFKYGARINPDLMMDLQCDFLPFVVNKSEQMEYLHWNYFPLFESKSNHIINKNLGLVAGKFVNTIDTIEAEGIKKTILLSSSPNSRNIATPALISGKENVNAPEDDKFKKADIPAAVLLEGKFLSLFRNRLSQAMSDSLKNLNTIFHPQCASDNKIIIVADGDMVLNAVQKGEPLPMGLNAYTYGSQYQYQFANKDFLQNCLEYLVNISGLSEAKAKDYTLRMLDTKKIESERSFWQIINIVIPILIVVLFALIFQFIRKRKYSV